MNHTYRKLLVTALAFAISLPALSAGEAPAGKPRAPVASEVSRGGPASRELSPDDEQYRELTGRVVYQVLLAEIALQRGNLELASQAYADLAIRTRDPKVLERTVEVASYARRSDLALEAARLWAQVEPSSPRAQQVLTSVLVMSNRIDELAPHLIRMLEVDKESLGANLLGLNRLLARNPDRQAVFRLIDKICAPFFGLAEAHYAVAMAASAAGEQSRAQAEAQRTLELRPDWEMAALLEAQLLARNSPVEAVASLEHFLGRNPKARDVQLHLARALVGEKRYVDAKRHFDQLLREYPDNPEIVYPVAILALQQNDTALAEAQFKRLLTLNFPDKGLASYYLGQIAEDAKRNDEALAYYSQVGAGEQYLPALMRAAHLQAGLGKLDAARKRLSEAKAATAQERVQLLLTEAQLVREAKQPQAAFDLLDRALADLPGQPELLYESALLAEKLGRVEILENNLRKVIELQPDSAQAYNALGYSLADRNMRLPEARELIEKALKLAPGDPFILDSLGWVLYRQGDLPTALTSLEQAYRLRSDPEIAAHLGEVLWMLGRKEDALQLWREAQKKDPGNELLADAVKKFAP